MANNRFDKKIVRSTLGLALMAVLFVLASLFAKEYENELRAMVGRDGAIGMGAYVLITMLAIVIAPVSTLPLIPVAVSVWGWVVAGTLSIIGWAIGSQIAFHLARRFGKPLVQKIVSLDKLAALEERFSEKNLFWTVVLLRMMIPVDILSYALGLFSRMGASSYFLATLIGITPFAFIFAYVGTFPLGLQVTALLILASVIIAAGMKR